MADKLIGNLITGNHVVPKPGMSARQIMTRVTTVVAVISIGSFLIWKFINFREERSVSRFLEEVQAGQYEAAYATWDAGPSYKLKDFVDDWGKNGYFTKGMREAHVVNSNGQGAGVVVCVEIDNIKSRVAIRVDKDSLRLSFPPADRCNARSVWERLFS